MRKIIKFQPYIFLVCCFVFIFIGCNNDELNEDLSNEEINETVTVSSFGKYQQLSLDEVTGFVDGIVLNKPLNGGSGVAKLNTSSEFLVGLDASSLAFEQVEGAELKIPTIKARLKHPEVKSKIFLVKVKDSTLAFLMNIVKDKSINNEGFSGIIGITDLTGGFVNGYRLKNGEFISQFVVAEKQKSNDSVKVTKSSFLFTTRTDPEFRWRSGRIRLSEVTVIAPHKDAASDSGGTGDGLKLSHRNYSGSDSFNFSNNDFSSGGGSGGPNEKTGRSINVFPCDDPLDGCDDYLLDDFDDEDDEIINELEGKAKCVYDKMVAGNNTINKILENFQDGNKPSQFNLKFQMSTTLGNETNASTKKSGNTFIISINQNTLSDRTALGLARTIIHEGIHARLREFLHRKGGIISKNDFPGVYEYYRKYGKNWDHQQMADFYRSTIALGLKQYDNGKRSDQFYNDMAWEGLANIVDANNKPNQIYTEAWKKLKTQEQNRIKNSIANEKGSGNKTCQ